MYIPSLAVLAYTIPRKTVTPIRLEKKGNGQIKERIRAMSPISNPTIQQLIVRSKPNFKILTWTVPENGTKPKVVWTRLKDFWLGKDNSTAQWKKEVGRRSGWQLIFKSWKEWALSSNKGSWIQDKVERKNCEVIFGVPTSQGYEINWTRLVPEKTVTQKSYRRNDRFMGKRDQVYIQHINGILEIKILMNIQEDFYNH